MNLPEVTRRDFIAWLGATAASLSLSPGTMAADQVREPAHAEKGGTDHKPRRIGLALGGGGAKGLAHVPVLEIFDELGIVPHAMSGTSMGAVIGALYAGGMKGSDIRALIDHLIFTKKDKLTEILVNKDILKWIDFIDPSWGGAGCFPQTVS